jgi:hypothetical protein
MRPVLPLIFLLLASPLALKAQILAEPPPSPPSAEQNKIYERFEVKPGFPGGEQALFSYLKDHFLFSEEIKKENRTSSATVEIILEATGKIASVKVMNGESIAFNKELVRVISGMPSWKPAVQNGGPVKALYHLSVTMVPPIPGSSTGDFFEDRVFVATEVYPAFAGGEAAAVNYLRKTYKPTLSGPTGLAAVSLVLNLDGTIRKQETKVLKGLGSKTDANLIKALNTLPAFIPAYQNKKPVAFKLVMLIRINQDGKIESVSLPVKGK